MAITSLAGYLAAKRDKIQWKNTTTYSFTTGVMSSLWRGTLAGANTANGVVPTITDWDATAAQQYPYNNVESFNGGLGYLTKARFLDALSGGCTYALFDLLFKAGAYTFSSNVTLASQPSYSARVPGGTDFTNTEIWLEAVTAFTGNATVAVTYTNQDGTAGRTTGTVAFGVAPGIRRMLRFPLQAGDTGVQKIESVVSTVATVGTFNILVLRRLAMGRTQGRTPFGASRHASDQDILTLGMPQVFVNMCPFMATMSDSASSTSAVVDVEVASG